MTEIMCKRSPAHERAVRRAWAERRARRMAQAGYDGERVRANEAVREARKYQGWWESISADAFALCNERDALAFKRRRAVKMALAQRRARQHAQFVAEARAAETAGVSRQLDEAVWQMARANNKRRRNALLARQRSRELVAAVNMMHDQADKLRAELETAKLSPTYFNAESGLEQVNLVLQQARFATVARERAENALAAMKARCERAEAARDMLADAVESMGTRLAKAEAAVRRLSAAA